jgi:FtsH-binding integral membrane protein
MKKGEISAESEQRRFMLRVYSWMCVGLSVTAVVAITVPIGEMDGDFGFGLFWFLVLAEIGLVFWLARSINKMSAKLATGVFLAYSVLNGLTIAPFLGAFTDSSVAGVFLITAGTFAAMSLYGYTTKQDLSSFGGFLIMGLVGILIAAVTNLFIQKSMADFVISSCTVLIFVGLTAYDTQRIKSLNVIGNEDTEADNKEAISGALILYLDFINLFMHLLSLFGKRR